MAEREGRGRRFEFLLFALHLLFWGGVRLYTLVSAGRAVALSDFGGFIEDLVGVLDAVVHIEYITSRVIDAPDHAPGVKLKGGPTLLIVDRDAAEICDGDDRVVWLSLLQRGTKLVGAGIAVEVERAGFVFDDVSCMKDEGGEGDTRPIRSSQPMASIPAMKSKTSPVFGIATIERVLLATSGRDLKKLPRPPRGSS